MPFFWFGGRKTFVLEIMSLLKKIPQTSSICLKFSVKCCGGMEVSSREKFFSWNGAVMTICYLHPVWEVLKENKDFIFFPLQLYCKKGQEGLFTVRKGVIVWNCYIRSQKRRAKRSVSCYYLVAVQQHNVQKWGCPGSAGCSVMKVRRCSKCACEEEWSLKNPCPTNLSRFYLGEFHSVRRDFVQNNWLKRIPSHRDYVL